VSAEPFGKRESPGVACPPDAKPAPPGAAGNTVDQNRLNPCGERSSGLYGSWNRRVKTEIPDYTQLRLDPLGKESAEEMLAALLGDGKGLVPLKRMIIERTEGTPSSWRRWCRRCSKMACCNATAL
jgi:hypothetical protein